MMEAWTLRGCWTKSRGALESECWVGWAISYQGASKLCRRNAGDVGWTGTAWTAGVIAAVMEEGGQKKRAISGLWAAGGFTLR